MHNINLEKFYFIDDFNKDHLRSLNKKTTIIYRNYLEKYNEKKIYELKKFCRSIKKKMFLANNIKLTTKLNLDGAYIPSFNKDLSVKKLKHKKIILAGSAHNLKEINEKKNQNMDLIFLSPIFKVKKNKQYLGVIKFNIMSNLLRHKTVALGGINKYNINQIKSLNCYGFASISYIKKQVKT